MLCISVLSRCLFPQTFPVSHQEAQMLLAKLEPMTDKNKEERDDIRVPCTGIVMQLKNQVRPQPKLGEVTRDSSF